MLDMTPEQWRDHLLPSLRIQATDTAELRLWLDGPHPWPTPPTAIKERLQRLCELAETNLCGLAVDAVAERLGVSGMRVTGDMGLDADLWRRVWQANYLDADSTEAHRDALTTGHSYLLVTPRDGADPQVTVEDPTECVIAYSPGSRRDRLAALKCYTAGDELVATVWTADEVVTWRSPLVAPARASAHRWQLHSDYPPAPNPLRVVPMVEMRCDGELGHKVVTTQKRINMTMFRLLMIGDYMIVPQRYLIGAEIQRGADGNPVNSLQSGPEHAWIIDAEDAAKVKIGQLDPADISQLLTFLEGDVTRFGAITKTPLYYVAGGLVNVSADAIRAAEAGLVAKVRRRQLTFGEAWEEAFSLAMQAMGVAAPDDIEIVWADAESRSLAARADAAVKLQAIGYPFPALARKMGDTEAEIARLAAERAAEPIAIDLVAAQAPVVTQ